MKEILSAEIEKGVKIKLSDGTIIVGIKRIDPVEKTNLKPPEHCLKII